MALLEAKNLSISFGGLRAVDEFNISIEKVSYMDLSVLTEPVKPQYLTFLRVFISPTKELSHLMALILRARVPWISIRQVLPVPSRT